MAALAVYAGTLGAGFVYDDDVLIRTNRWVQDASVFSQLPFKPLLASPPMGTTNYYRPLVVVLYNLTWHSLGGRPVAFHILNVVLHMINATLLFLLVRRLAGGRDGIAAGSAILFAVHPLNVEVVAWPSCLPELGYVAFGLSSLLCHVASWDRNVASARRPRIAAVLLFVLAFSCKETALAFVPLAFLLELWLRPGGSARARPDLLAAARGVVPYVGAAALFLVARTAVLGGLVARGAPGKFSANDAVWSAPWLLLLYVKSMLLPFPLLVAHVVTLVTAAADPRFLIGGALGVAAIVAILRLQLARPDLAFAACAAVIPVLPALYLPALGHDAFAERYAYLGVAAFCWLLVAGAEALARRATAALPSWALPSLLCALVIAASFRTITRCADWHDDGSLGLATMRDEPRASTGYLLAGNWHLREGRKDEALRVFDDGVSHAPESAELQQNAIALGLELGRLSPENALGAYQHLAPSAAGSASVQYNLGQSLLQLGRLDEAKAAFNRSLELSPASVASLTALAVIASQQGDAAGSVALCRKALAIDDHAKGALQQLGVALMRTGDIPGAVTALEAAVRLDPEDKESLSRLGVAYARTGRLDDARRVWEQALAIDPGFASARQNLERLRQMAR